MSKIMKYLSEEYKGRYDGKVAVEIIKSWYNNVNCIYYNIHSFI